MGISTRPRIQLNDKISDVILKMSGGNPGAITVLIEIVKETPRIDPQQLLSGIGMVLLLDTFGIYEDQIWMLYKDLCGHDLVKTLACLRACQLGIITEQQLKDSIDSKGIIVDCDDVLNKVKEKLTEFDKATVEIAEPKK